MGDMFHISGDAGNLLAPSALACCVTPSQEGRMVDFLPRPTIIIRC